MYNQFFFAVSGKQHPSGPTMTYKFGVTTDKNIRELIEDTQWIKDKIIREYNENLMTVSIDNVSYLGPEEEVQRHKKYYIKFKSTPSLTLSKDVMYNEANKDSLEEIVDYINWFAPYRPIVIMELKEFYDD